MALATQGCFVAVAVGARSAINTAGYEREVVARTAVTIDAGSRTTKPGQAWPVSAA